MKEMMRKQILVLFFGLTTLLLNAQNADTSIYKIVEDMPRFPGCEQLYDDVVQKRDCAGKKMLEFIYQNIRYPEEARMNGIEGTVVLKFVVEKDGSVSNAAVVKEIGGGCGNEALRIINGMNGIGLAWVPGKKAGVAVRCEMTFPIKFKLEAPKDYVLIGKDTVYAVVDTPPVFKGGEVALKAYLEKNLVYPAVWKDSCTFGHMDVTLLVHPNGQTYVLELSNYNNLEFDFVWETILRSHKMWHLWEPAKHKGRAVTSAVDFRITFQPIGAACQGKWEKFQAAEKMAEEGTALFNEGKQEDGLKKLNDVVNQFPLNAQFRYMRGQALVQMKRMGEACEDYGYVRQVLNIPEVNQLAILICGSQK